ncbi:MAG TPA: EAL domain-containing protein [Micropepsaceae bacterium]|nr:EAL domain-containing protein [Micropepsaceae bacterium]
MTITDHLHSALERNELELYYQPQAELASGRIIDLEALVRWNHPERGLVAASEFISTAEKTDVILLLGKWAFEQTCRQTKLWNDAGIAPAVAAVNVSALECKRAHFLEDVAECLVKWEIRPDQMEVELTESVLMEATQNNCNLVERLRILGLRIAIDDFGTGYSSLDYLTNYPVDRLKIAQELVFGIATNSRNASVVRIAISLADELGIEVLAEGVETETQARILASAGRKWAQGYLFSKPVSAKRATDLLRKESIRYPKNEKAIATGSTRNAA